jgi:perosamine synthetase
MDELVARRKECANLIARATESFDWLLPQHVPADRGHSYWCYTLLLDEDGPRFQTFADEFARQGGDPLYAAWKLTYMEPYFSQALGTGPGLCPVAESIQPRLLQFKTNYYDTKEAERHADIVHATASTLDKA